MLPHIVPHELIHFQQGGNVKDTITLGYSINEGMADFIGELISGKSANPQLLEWVKGKEQKLSGMSSILGFEINNSRCIFKLFIFLCSLRQIQKCLPRMRRFGFWPFLAVDRNRCLQDHPRADRVVAFIDDDESATSPV